MNDIERMQADRVVRDAARALVADDVARIRRGLDQRSIPARALDRTTEGAADLLEELSTVASRHKGVIATIIGAFTLWLARNPLLDLFETEPDQPTETPHDQP